ncbi:MAG: S1/P1 nuclease [Planctomycetes bacterium]|nr:S1/P1 nuclease [Planctomycetota bacterium]
MNKFARLVMTFAVWGIAIVMPVPLHAWSEGGHHLIAVIAFNLLSGDEQEKLLTILKKHPRFEEDFKLPDNLTTELDKQRWLVGRAAYWPDVARRQPLFHRSTWHYELGASQIIGDRSELNIPQRPRALPLESTLETKELYISQALELCQRAMHDQTTSAEDRAVALCWLGHLVGDAHQPCHAGSLYMQGVFETEDGDRGANSIPTKQRRNMHALWDGLLGSDWSLGGNRRRFLEITQDSELMNLGRQSVVAGIDPAGWLSESRSLAVEHVYTDEVLSSLHLVRRGVVEKPQEIELTEGYLKNAGRVAQRRAVQAGYRLAEVWRQAIKEQ